MARKYYPKKKPSKKTSAKKPARKQYSPADKFFYHMDRHDPDSPASRKVSNISRWYSQAFCDAFKGRNASDWARAYDGDRGGRAYDAGYQRGKKAAQQFYHSTGMDPADLHREWWKMTH